MKNNVLLFVCIGLIVVLAIEKIFFNERQEINAKEKESPSFSGNINFAPDWSDESRQMLNRLKDKYGDPAARTSTMMIWENAGPWKRIVLHSKAVNHNFPVPHQDVLEQTLNYQVPPEKFSELAQYDGSIVCNRTNGEISVRCDMEAMNFLALNLADEIIRGEKSIGEARDFHARVANEYLKGIKDPYTQRIRFSLERGDTKDPDKMVTSKEQTRMTREDDGAELRK